MKKTVLLLLFSFQLVAFCKAQTDFILTNRFKEKIVHQTDYFTFYFKNLNKKQMNKVYEGYVEEIKDSVYNVKVFFEEYETIDSVYMNRCNVSNACDKYVDIHLNEINYFQHNNTNRLGTSKMLFGLGAVSLASSTVFALFPGIFQKEVPSTTNPGEMETITNTTAQTVAVSSGLGLTGLSVFLAIKIMSPKKYHTTKTANGKGGWHLVNKR